MLKSALKSVVQTVTNRAKGSRARPARMSPLAALAMLSPSLLFYLMEG